jgi:hypothetical protein
MRITRTAKTLELSRTPTGMYALGLALLAGGVFSLYVLAVDHASLSLRDQLIVGLIGAGVAAGGMYSMATTFRTRLRVDLATGDVRYERSAPFRRRLVVEAARPDVDDVIIRQEHDSDGDPWYVLELLVADEPPLMLAGVGQHGRAELERIRGEVTGTLRLGEREPRGVGRGKRSAAVHRES